MLFVFLLPLMLVN